MGKLLQKKASPTKSPTFRPCNSKLESGKQSAQKSVTKSPTLPKKVSGSTKIAKKPVAPKPVKTKAKAKVPAADEPPKVSQQTNFSNQNCQDKVGRGKKRCPKCGASKVPIHCAKCNAPGCDFQFKINHKPKKQKLPFLGETMYAVENSVVSD